ncbi:MAG: TonB-dependent receptor, partial [Bacteroidia bacterium]|nr:TonB-dependent receptor [Bacteroidia bacterium]
MKKINFIVTSLGLWFLWIIQLNAQTPSKFTLKGYIKDAKTGEEVIGASIIVKDKNIGTYSNEYGFYSLTLPVGTYTLLFKYLSLKDQEKTIVLDKDQTLNVEMSDASVQLQTLEIAVEEKSQELKDPKMSVLSVDVAKLKTIPVLFGEQDVLKTIQLMPGIQFAGDGNTGFNVRGGSTDQNMILLDEATVYNASHLLGFFSVFNSDAIKDVDVYKGGIPAKYGGRLSSLLDIRMREGNNKQWSGTGGIGLISSRITVEGPIVKERGSLIFSGRRTYGDLFLKLSPNKRLRNNQLYFYDFNLKANYRINDNNRIFLSGYFGRDQLGLENLFGFDWGNATATIRWNHLFSDKLFCNVTGIFSDFNYGINIEISKTQNFSVTSGIRDYAGKLDFSYYISPTHQLNFGLISTYHAFKPGKVEPRSAESIINTVEMPSKYALESSAYLDHEWKVSPIFTVRGGLRATIFNNYGPGREFEFNTDRSVKDTLTFSSGQLIKSYAGFEPRLAMSYALSEKVALKASYNRTLQFIHQISN